MDDIGVETSIIWRTSVKFNWSKWPSSFTVGWLQLKITRSNISNRLSIIIVPKSKEHLLGWNGWFLGERRYQFLQRDVDLSNRFSDQTANRLMPSRALRFDQAVSLVWSYPSRSTIRNSGKYKLFRHAWILTYYICRISGYALDFTIICQVSFSSEHPRAVIWNRTWPYYYPIPFCVYRVH